MHDPVDLASENDDWGIEGRFSNLPSIAEASIDKIRIMLIFDRRHHCAFYRYFCRDRQPADIGYPAEVCTRLTHYLDVAIQWVSYWHFWRAFCIVFLDTVRHVLWQHIAIFTCFEGIDVSMSWLGAEALLYVITSARSAIFVVWISILIIHIDFNTTCLQGGLTGGISPGVNLGRI